MSRPIYRDVLQRLIEKLRTLVDFKKKIVKRGLDKAGVQQNIQILISRGGGRGVRGAEGEEGEVGFFFNFALRCNPPKSRTLLKIEMTLKLNK